MRKDYPSVAMGKLCIWFGITRQAYSQNNRRINYEAIEADLIMQQVRKIRGHHGRIGGRKLHHMLCNFLKDHNIKIGRDKLFDLLGVYGLLIKKRKRNVYTTMSHHWLRKYSNLIKGLDLIRSNQLWVSDITYWKVTFGFVYISFITDAYSHMIVGYHLSDSLESIETLHALNMALTGLDKKSSELIHHSDRGVQYCSHIYVDMLKSNQIKISMTENGDPLENSIAERLNGIIKEEYLYDKKVGTLGEANLALADSVRFYNTERPHSSINNLTPQEVHNMTMIEKPKRLWKNYYPKKLNLYFTTEKEFS